MTRFGRTLLGKKTEAYVSVYYDDVRMDDGFSDGLDKRRIEDMGNAVIPVIAYYLFECIKIFDKQLE